MSSRARDLANRPITNFVSTGIDDNADGLAITIDANENVGIGVTNPSDYNASINNLVVGSIASGSHGITVASHTAGTGYLSFADGATTAADEYRGLIEYDHSANTMHLRTDAVKRLTIDINGNVGVGTDTPQGLVVSKQATDVDESINFVAEGFGNVGDTCGYYFASHGVDAPRRKAGILLKKTGDYGIGDLHFVLDSNTDDASLSLASDTKMTILSDGNVGIGTKLPGTIVEIEKDQNAGTLLTIDNNTAGAAANAGLNITSDTASSYLRTFSGSFTTSGRNIANSLQLLAAGCPGGLVVASSHATADMSFWTNDTQRLTIDGATGNVGIGEPAPAHPLRIVQKANGTTALSVRSTVSNATSSMNFSTNIGAVDWFIGKNVAGASAGDVFSMGTSATATGAFAINSSGNVGIGNDNPAGYYAGCTDLVVGNHTGEHGITICSQSTEQGRIAFGDSASGAANRQGLIEYNHNNSFMDFSVSDALKFRIRSTAGQMELKDNMLHLNTSGGIVYCAGGTSTGNASFNLDFTWSTGGYQPIHVFAMHSHWTGNYGTVRESYLHGDSYSGLTELNQYNSTGSLVGSWSFSRHANNKLRLSKNAGSTSVPIGWNVWIFHGGVNTLWRD